MRVCTLASSSSGNCTLVSFLDTHILIDAGISMRRIKTALSGLDLTPEELSGIIITHEHNDHISGLKMMTKYYKTRLYAPSAAADAICALVPAACESITDFAPGSELCIGDISIKSFPTPHDTPQSVGYRLSCGGRVLAFATDLGCVTADVAKNTAGADLAIIEANHDEKMLKNGCYPYYLKQRILSDHGHLSNRISASFASELTKSGVQRIVLAHLSRENNTPTAAYNAVAGSITSDGARIGDDVFLSVAPPDCSGEVYII